MSPSINELFGAPGSEAEADFDFDMDKLMGAVDVSLAESTRFRDPQNEQIASEGGESEAVAPPVEIPPDDSGEPSDDATDDRPTGNMEAGDEEEPGEPASPPPAVVDPLGLLPPERRAALLAIDEVVQKDPAKRDRVLAALRDEAQAAQAPSLPEDIEEGSVAARLWHETQQVKADQQRILAAQKAQSDELTRQRAVSAADAAGAEFAQRYAGKLESDDIVAIAQAAGSSGLAGRLATGAADLKGAYLQALESTLWTEPAFRTKVLTEATPIVAVSEQPESKARKRKLTALSSSASPSSAPAPKQSPLETRVDGRLTPQSRFKVVQDIATQLNRSQNEGTY